MKSKYLSNEELLLAPQIRPSDGKNVKYSEVIGGNGRIVILQYSGICVGHTVFWRVRGDGTELSSFVVEKLEPEYEVVLRFDRVFDKESVVASYTVRDTNDKVFGYSEERRYKVLR
ncbi:hypothetical protein C4J85_3357 [Pseudomonas sp. R4-34-07]|uniref:hypothetical protein n=1 Tax=Pseudomonas sp. R4-34-07 TaxID=658642 RepID=UPI000F580675|nr:hypothetical protein [Pseudomonas sp. R4-34-07]AZF53839.1 hypothetical protein C4J85_3357 [Pseudomonas sp. R4-34-07]